MTWDPNWDEAIAKADAAFHAKFPTTEHVAFNIGAVCLDGHFDVHELREILAQQEALLALERPQP